MLRVLSAQKMVFFGVLDSKFQHREHFVTKMQLTQVTWKGIRCLQSFGEVLLAKNLGRLKPLSLGGDNKFDGASIFHSSFNKKNRHWLGNPLALVTSGNNSGFRAVWLLVIHWLKVGPSDEYHLHQDSWYFHLGRNPALTVLGWKKKLHSRHLTHWCQELPLWKGLACWKPSFFWATKPLVSRATFIFLEGGCHLAETKRLSKSAYKEVQYQFVHLSKVKAKSTLILDAPP